MPVTDYNADPDLNTQISGINIAEGCAPSGINNAIRQLMADVKKEFESEEEAVSSLDTSLRALIAEKASIFAAYKEGVALDDITIAGTYYVSGENVGIPSGVNGYVLVICTASDKAIRQVFYRVGTINDNEHNIYTRTRNSSGKWGDWTKMLTARDSAIIAGFAMASERYSNLTFGANGAVYTAPENGWVNIVAADSNKKNCWLTLDVQTSEGTRYLRNQQVTTEVVNDCMLYVPVRKGDRVRLGYSSNSNFSASIFRFIYAEGAK